MGLGYRKGTQKGLRGIRHYDTIDKQEDTNLRHGLDAKQCYQYIWRRMQQRLTLTGCMHMELKCQKSWATLLDTYNYADKMRRSRIANGDANATLVYFEGKANTYLSEKFCAEFRTTSRSKRINVVVNKFSKSSHTILGLVQNLELVVREYWNKEILLQFNSIYMNSVMTTCLRSIEIATTRVYTRELFSEVRKEIEGAGAVNLAMKKRCLDTTYLCRHMFFVMKAEHLWEIPERLVLQQWRKDVKDVNQYIEKWDDSTQRGFLV
ncbi:hypothetical protein Ahy_A05g025237 [Arachis hypogaea]|uniref:Protein FAR1-RELATED SEQUENCE n=1 Tax=Arachis hypogaea TaxID=3818 RepID=A0A445D7Y3_ARAHY|nr:hypothetical protein Ahy_A05g025237 [Arachis hypogaea]